MKYVRSLEWLSPSARLKLSTYVRDWKSSEDTARRFTFGKLVPVSDRIPIERITIWISFLHGDINPKIHSRCQVVTAHERLSIKRWGIALDRSHCRTYYKATPKSTAESITSSTVASICSASLARPLQATAIVYAHFSNSIPSA